MKSKKTYTWEEVKKVLIKELKKTKHIMTFGTIGSNNIDHDVDVIVTKKPKSASADFWKEMHVILDNLHSYLKKKHGVNLLHMPNFNYFPEFMKLSHKKPDDFVLHVLAYNSYPSLEDDWKWAMFRGEKVRDVLKPCDFLIGSFDDLFSKEFQKANYTDNLFLYISYWDRTNSNYSEKFLIEVMDYFFDYVFRKRLGIKKPLSKNRKQVRENLYKLCDEFDKLNKRKG